MVNMFGITHSGLPPPQLHDLTNMVIRVLTPEVRDDMIRIKECVIYGKRRSGKTYLEKSLAEKIVEHYGEENVDVYISDSFTALVRSLDTPTRKCPACGKWILDKKTCSACGEKLDVLGKKKNVHVLIVDDPLKRYLSRGGTTREQRDAIGDYEAIAHKLEDKLKTKTGVGLIIIGSQQYKGLEKTFRGAVVRIFKTTMEEDQDYINKKILCRPICIRKLYEITDDIFVKDKDERRDTSIALVGEQHEGKCVFPPYEEDYAVDVSGYKEKYQLRYKDKNKLIADLVDEVKSSGIDASVSNFRSAVKGLLMKKHPNMKKEMRKYGTIVCDALVYEKYQREIDKKQGIEASFYADYKLKKDDRAFVWEHEVEKPRLFRFLGDGTKKADDVPKMLRAYELVCLEGKSQKEAVKCMIKEGVVDKCTQSTVSRWCKAAQGCVNNLRGLKYEAHVRERLKEETIKGLFDKCNIKKVYRFGDIKRSGKNYPDLMVVYDNNDIDVVSCKCFSKKNYRVNVITQQNCDVSPELNTFTRLKNGEDVALPDDTVLKSNPNNAVRLVFLMNCINKEYPCEFYKVYEKLEELPRVLNVSRSGLEKKIFKRVNWNKKVKKPSKKPSKKPVKKPDRSIKPDKKPKQEVDKPKVEPRRIIIKRNRKPLTMEERFKKMRNEEKVKYYTKDSY